jgi:hypothetical protein
MRRRRHGLYLGGWWQRSLRISTQYGSMICCSGQRSQGICCCCCCLFINRMQPYGYGDETDKYKNGITPSTFRCAQGLLPQCHRACFHIWSSGPSALFAQRPLRRTPPFPPPFPSHFFPFARLYFLSELSLPVLHYPSPSPLSPRPPLSSSASMLPHLASLPSSSSVL